MKIIGETERIILREMRVEDAADAYRLNLDPEVIRFTGDVAFESVEEAKIFIEGYTHYRDYGFGRWAVIRKTDNHFLGWCGLNYTPSLDEYDIGFRFLKECWNQGYATEAAIACLELGFNQFQMETIVGRAMSENGASIRVLEKIGLRYQKRYKFENEDGVIFAITKAEFLKEKH